MPRYERRVTETRAYSCLYTIEAEDEAAADEKALRGETEEETTLACTGVLVRQLDTEE